MEENIDLQFLQTKDKIFADIFLKYQELKEDEMFLDFGDLQRKFFEEIIEFVKDRPGHDLRYKLDCRKVREEIGFRPKVSIDQGLRRTVDWCLKHKDWMLSKYEQINKLYRYG